LADDMAADLGGRGMRWWDDAPRVAVGFIQADGHASGLAKLGVVIGPRLVITGFADHDEGRAQPDAGWVEQRWIESGRGDGAPSLGTRIVGDAVITRSPRQPHWKVMPTEDHDVSAGPGDERRRAGRDRNL
jgi:hypothetical protein